MIAADGSYSATCCYFRANWRFLKIGGREFLWKSPHKIVRTALSKKNDPDGLLFLMEISRNPYMPKISIHHISAEVLAELIVLHLHLGWIFVLKLLWKHQHLCESCSDKEEWPWWIQRRTMAASFIRSWTKPWLFYLKCLLLGCLLATLIGLESLQLKCKIVITTSINQKTWNKDWCCHVQYNHPHQLSSWVGLWSNIVEQMSNLGYFVDPL